MCRKRRFNCLTGLSAGDVALWAVSNHLLWVDEGEGEGAASLFVEIRNEICLRHLRRKQSFFSSFRMSVPSLSWQTLVNSRLTMRKRRRKQAFFAPAAWSSRTSHPQTGDTPTSQARRFSARKQPFHEFLLRLSRACLGKMIIY